MFKYKRVGWRKIELTGIKGSFDTRNLIIPPTYKNKKVTSIGEGAFKGKGIEVLTIQDGVEWIKPQAFAENKIELLTISGGCYTLGSDIFEGNQIRNIRLKSLNKPLLPLGVFGKYVKNIELPELTLESYKKLLNTYPGNIEAIYTKQLRIDRELVLFTGLNVRDIALFVQRGQKEDFGQISKWTDVEIVEVDSPGEFREIIKVSTSF